MTAAQEPRAGEALKPCPFCGDEMASVVCGEIYHKNGDRDCPIIGRDAYIPAEKVAAWNTRPSESSASVDRIGTHGPGCWAWGSRHYACAVAEIERLRTQAPAREGELEEAARAAYRACMSAWSCGEPYHRVKTMMDAMDRLGIVLDEPGAQAALSRQHQEGEGRE